MICSSHIKFSNHNATVYGDLYIIMVFESTDCDIQIIRLTLESDINGSQIKVKCDPMMAQLKIVVIYDISIIIVRMLLQI